jgi:hypothetical protein
MKNLSDILRRSNITPLERVTALVHNDVFKEKNGKDMLSNSDIYVLTKAWSPRAFEAQEYNRYINIVQLESSMKMDTQMFLYRSEISLLRNQRALDSLLSSIRSFKGVTTQEFSKDISDEESINLLTQSTYFEYQKLLHRFTFNNLPKEIREDFLLLDDAVASDNKYLEDQVFLYELLKDGNKLSQQNKDLIIGCIYSCIYYEGAKKMKRNATEKDGFLLHRFFAELSAKDIFLKLAYDRHISFENTEEDLLSAIESYAKSKDSSIEFLIKETLSLWLDAGLFISDYSPLYTSNRFNTWNGNTKKSHNDLFIAWYTELQKSKQYFQKLIETGKLVKQNLEKDFLGMSKVVEVINGSSLYACTENVHFVKEYKEQIKTLLPLAQVFLFARKHATPVKNYKTLCELKNIAQKISSIFDIDMTEKYNEFIESYKEEVILINYSLARFASIAIEYLYTEKSLNYILDISEDNFIFDLNSDNEVSEIVELYSTELKKREK